MRLILHAVSFPIDETTRREHSTYSISLFKSLLIAMDWSDDTKVKAISGREGTKLRVREVGDILLDKDRDHAALDLHSPS